MEVSESLEIRRLAKSQEYFTQQVALLVNETILELVQEYLSFPIVSDSSYRSKMSLNLEMLAMLKEYSVSYESSSVPKGETRININ